LTDKKVKIDIPTAALDGSIKELNGVIGQIQSLTNNIVGAIGGDPTSMIALLYVAISAFQEFERNKDEYEKLIMEAKGFIRDEEYENWQANQRRIAREEYKGDSPM